MEFDNTILQIADRIQRTLEFIPDEIKCCCEEIRIRAGLPVCLTVDGKVFFVCQNSVVTTRQSKNCLIATHNEVMQTLSLLCKNSVYMHENEIKQGFVSLPCGSRAGVCGVFNTEGMLISVTSINIRIARQIFDCAIPLLPHIIGGLLIVGPPSSGKTTMLRDLIRLLSNGKKGCCQRVAVIDSRGELSGGGVLDLGVNTDVLYTLDKAKGTDIALRTMFPNIIAFDELGTTAELQSIKNCFNAGVTVITTAHGGKEEDIIRRDVTREIIESGAISRVALLSNKVGELPQIIDVKELFSGALG